MAISRSKATVTSTGKLQVQVNVRSHEFYLDEPKDTSGGQDTGISPVEALLTALGGCKVIMAKSFARQQGINLNSISIEVTGELDNDGYMQRNPNVRPGIPKINCIYHINADNTDDEIKAFVEFVDRYCPVADTITNGAEIISTIDAKRQGE